MSFVKEDDFTSFFVMWMCFIFYYIIDLAKASRIVLNTSSQTDILLLFLLLEEKSGQLLQYDVNWGFL